MTESVVMPPGVRVVELEFICSVAASALLLKKKNAPMHNSIVHDPILFFVILFKNISHNNKKNDEC